MQAIDNALLRLAVGMGQDYPLLRTAARGVTELGGWRWLIPLTAAIAAWLFYRHQGRRAVSLLIVTLAGRQLVEWLKLLMDRARPALFDHAVDLHSLSFPSGHAANSMIVYLGVALIVGPVLTHRTWPVAAALIMAGLIGATRPLLAVHWPTDVVAGWALGLAWTLSSVWLLTRWIEGQPVTRLPQDA